MGDIVSVEKAFSGETSEMKGALILREVAEKSVGNGPNGLALLIGKGLVISI